MTPLSGEFGMYVISPTPRLLRVEQEEDDHMCDRYGQPADSVRRGRADDNEMPYRKDRAGPWDKISVMLPILYTR